MHRGHDLIRMGVHTCPDTTARRAAETCHWRPGLTPSALTDRSDVRSMRDGAAERAQLRAGGGGLGECGSKKSQKELGKVPGEVHGAERIELILAGALVSGSWQAQPRQQGIINSGKRKKK